MTIKNAETSHIPDITFAYDEQVQMSRAQDAHGDKHFERKP